MHSFGPSRGRIFFEVLCALMISASLVGAWMQTGASALLAAAGVAALYGLVHPFGRKAAPVPPANREEPAREVAGPIELHVPRDTAVKPSVDPEPATGEVVVEPERVEPIAPKATASRAKAARKSGSRRPSAPKKAKTIELVPPPEVIADSSRPEQDEFDRLMSADEASHAHIEPLFEPAPFARMSHRAFGRKAG